MSRPIQSLARGTAILRLLAGGERRLGLSEVAASLGLPKGTAHGILRTLREEGFVDTADIDAECALTRERGWAASVEETWEGVASVGALVRDHGGSPVGAVGVSGAVERLCQADVVRPGLASAVRYRAGDLPMIWAPRRREPPRCRTDGAARPLGDRSG